MNIAMFPTPLLGRVRILREGSGGTVLSFEGQVNILGVAAIQRGWFREGSTQYLILGLEGVIKGKLLWVYAEDVMDGALE